MIDFYSKLRYDFDDLCQLVKVLRAPDGCPWDSVQTHQSIRRNFLEEAYEACEASRIRSISVRSWAMSCCMWCFTQASRRTPDALP